jgi:hypothetical protein
MEGRRVRLKPAETGLLVKDPKTRIPLSEDGEEKDETTAYWARRLRDGSVIEAAEPKSPKTTRRRETVEE